MNDPIAYSHASKKGPFWIVLKPDGKWHVTWEDEHLGSYANPHEALTELEGGSTHWPSCGDPAGLGLSDDLADWRAHFPRLAR